MVNETSSYDPQILFVALRTSWDGRGGPFAGRVIRPNTDFDWDFCQGMVMLRYFNVPQIMTFRDIHSFPGDGSFEEVGCTFDVLAPYQSFSYGGGTKKLQGDALVDIHHAVTHRLGVSLDSRRKSTFDRHFEKPEIFAGSRIFRGCGYEGVGVSVEIKSLTGSQGGLDRELFASVISPHLFNVIVWPMVRAVKEHPEMAYRSWMGFGGS
jgi:hypothetical protein